MARVMGLILVLWSAMLLSSCFDPEPGEISVRCTNKGRRMGCAIQLYNANMQQIDLVPTDLNGIQFLELPPGKYTLKFQDPQGNQYPAEVTVDLGSGESAVLDVELSEPPASETP